MAYIYIYIIIVKENEIYNCVFPILDIMKLDAMSLICVQFLS